MIVPDVEAGGGDWPLVRTLARALRARGHYVWLASTSNRDVSRTDFNGFSRLHVQKGLAVWIGSIFRLRTFPACFDIIHAHNPRALLFGRLIRAFSSPGAALLLTWHFDTKHDRAFKEWFRYWILKSANRIHCVSEQSREHVVRECGLPRTRTTVAFPGIQTDEFQEPSAADRRAARATFGLNDDVTVLLFAGRLAPEKNVDLILDFFRDYKAVVASQNLRLLIVGSGHEEQGLRMRVKQEGYADRVHFTGYLRPVNQAYVAADLLVLPSSSETFGLVVVEAALCAVACLRSNLPGAAEQIIEGINGAVFPANNPEAFHEKMKALVSDRARLAEMGASARRIALERFDIRYRVQKIEAIYFSTLSSGSRS